MPASSAPLDFATIGAIGAVSTVEPSAVWHMHVSTSKRTLNPQWAATAYGVLGIGLAFLGTVVVHAIIHSMPTSRAATNSLANLPLRSYFSLGPHILPYALFLILNIRRTLQQICRPCERREDPPDESIAWLLPNDGAATVERQVSAIDRSAVDMYRTGVEFTLLSVLLIITGVWHIDHNAPRVCL